MWKAAKWHKMKWASKGQTGSKHNTTCDDQSLMDHSTYRLTSVYTRAVIADLWEDCMPMSFIAYSQSAMTWLIVTRDWHCIVDSYVCSATCRHQVVSARRLSQRDLSATLPDKHCIGLTHWMKRLPPFPLISLTYQNHSASKFRLLSYFNS